MVTTVYQIKEHLCTLPVQHTVSDLINNQTGWSYQSVNHRRSFSNLNGGRQSIPAGDATAAFERMDCVLRKHCIYIVPVGELEGFVKEIGGHGPVWVNEVFEKYSDLDNPVYEQAKNFIQSIEL